MFSILPMRFYPADRLTEIDNAAWIKTYVLPETASSRVTCLVCKYAGHAHAIVMRAMVVAVNPQGRLEF